jgi:hypothetical protein
MFYQIRTITLLLSVMVIARDRNQQVKSKNKLYKKEVIEQKFKPVPDKSNKINKVKIINNSVILVWSAAG